MAGQFRSADRIVDQEDPPGHHRSSQPFNRLRRTLVVVPLSSAHEQTEFPLLIAIRSTGRPGVAVVDQLKAAAKERFIRKLGVANTDEMKQINEALATLLNLV